MIKKLGQFFVAVILILNIMIIGAPAQASDSDSDSDSNSDSTNILDKDVYISEIYAFSGSDKYIELYFNTDIEQESYYFLTATTETATESNTKMIPSFTVEEVTAGTYLTPIILDFSELTNPNGDKILWLCPASASKLDCRSKDLYLDKVQYSKVKIDQSFSRDFDDPDLPVKVSLKTPNQPNQFSVASDDNGDNDDDNLDEEPVATPYCTPILLNEISFADPEKFVEVINESDEIVDLSYCAVRRGNNLLTMSGELLPGALKSFNVVGSTLAQSNSAVNIRIYDLVDEVEIMENRIAYKAVKTGASWAYFDDEEQVGWLQTFAPTPGQPNVYQQFQTCEAGKIINVNTGNCILIASEPAPCPVGQYRNPETGRCKKLAGETSTLTACQDRKSVV
jgi:hypothetical protein